MNHIERALRVMAHFAIGSMLASAAWIVSTGLQLVAPAAVKGTQAAEPPCRCQQSDPRPTPVHVPTRAPAQRPMPAGLST